MGVLEPRARRAHGALEKRAWLVPSWSPLGTVLYPPTADLTGLLGLRGAHFRQPHRGRIYPQTSPLPSPSTYRILTKFLWEVWTYICAIKFVWVSLKNIYINVHLVFIYIEYYSDMYDPLLPRTMVVLHLYRLVEIHHFTDFLGAFRALTRELLGAINIVVFKHSLNGRSLCLLNSSGDATGDVVCIDTYTLHHTLLFMH